METRLVQIVAKLLKTSEAKAGVVMYSIISFYIWIQIIDDLFVLDGTYPKSLKRWRAVVKSLKEENDIRVGLAHYSISQGDVEPGEELRAIQACAQDDLTFAVNRKNGNHSQWLKSPNSPTE